MVEELDALEAADRELLNSMPAEFGCQILMMMTPRPGSCLIDCMILAEGTGSG